MKTIVMVKELIALHMAGKIMILNVPADGTPSAGVMGIQIK